MPMFHLSRSATLLLCLVALGTLRAAEAVPAEILYQGRIKDDGLHVDGQRTITVAIYDAATGGSALWSEEHVDVPVVKGLFNLTLGSITPISDDVLAREELWIRVSVAGQALPRQPLHSTPHARVAGLAIHARSAESAANAATASTAVAVSAGAVDSAALADGAVSDSKLDAALAERLDRVESRQDSGWAAARGRAGQGTTLGDYTADVGIDASGRLMVTGRTEGTFAGQVNAGAYDFFLARWDTTGTFLDASQAGTSKGDTCLGAVTANDGTTYAAGFTYGDWDGVHQGNGDVVVVQWLPDGSLGWVDQFGTSTHDRGYDAALDDAGNLYLTGLTRGDIEGEPYSGHGTDTFITKYDNTGTRLWTTLLAPSDDSDLVRAIAVDDTGGIFVTGASYGSLGDTNQGQSDCFVARLASNGSISWINQFGGSDYEFCNDILIDASGRVVVVGRTQSDLFSTNNGGDDAMVFRMEAVEDGNVDGIQFGTAGNEELEAVDLTPDGALLMAGVTDEAMDRRLPRALGGDDMLVVRVDDALYLDWVRQYGTRNFDYATGLAVGADGGIHVCAYSSGIWAATSPHGDYDVALLKLLRNGVLP